MTDLSDIKPGDQVSVLNGRMNAVFDGEVVSAQDGIVLVDVPAKFTRYAFDWASGVALDGHSRIVKLDDWRAVLIRTQKRHGQFHEELIQAATEFRREPSEETADAVADVLTAWRVFALAADPLALTTRSVQEYLQEGGTDGSRD